MPAYTIETAYRLPVYRQKTYSASTLEAACEVALHDGDWSATKEDVDTAGKTYVSGAWEGADSAYRGATQSVSSQFHEMAGRMQDHFTVLLRCLKEVTSGRTITIGAYAAIAKADAIMADASDPDTRALIATPWGRADGVRIHGEGIVFYSTPSHGGFYLDAERNALVPDDWRKDDGWYEEDVEWAKVAITFPHCFDSKDLDHAAKVIDHYYRPPG